jgi:hypothetical protein
MGAFVREDPIGRVELGIQRFVDAELKVNDDEGLVL